MEDARQPAGATTLDLVLAGAADQINNTLAIVLLNVELLDGLLDEAAAASARPREADALIGDLVAGVMRIRDCARGLAHLASDEPGDAADTIAVLLGMVRGELGLEPAALAGVRGPAPTGAPRRLIAAATALAVGELTRAAPQPPSLRVAVREADADVVVSIHADGADGAAAFAPARGAWRAIEALLADVGGSLACDARPDGVAIDLRLPRASSPQGV